MTERNSAPWGCRGGKNRREGSVQDVSKCAPSFLSARPVILSAHCARAASWRSVTGQMIDAHRGRYAKLLREPDVNARSVEEIVEADFLNASREEVGASLGEVRAGLEALKNKLVADGRCYLDRN